MGARHGLARDARRKRSRVLGLVAAPGQGSGNASNRPSGFRHSRCVRGVGKIVVARQAPERCTDAVGHFDSVGGTPPGFWFEALTRSLSISPQGSRRRSTPAGCGWGRREHWALPAGGLELQHLPVGEVDQPGGQQPAAVGQDHGLLQFLSNVRLPVGPTRRWRRLSLGLPLERRPDPVALRHASAVAHLHDTSLELSLDFPYPSLRRSELARGYTTSI